MWFRWRPLEQFATACQWRPRTHPDCAYTDTDSTTGDNTDSQSGSSASAGHAIIVTRNYRRELRLEFASPSSRGQR